MLLLALLFAAAPPERVLVQHDFYPGFLGPRAERTTYTLTLSPDGGASLAITVRETDQRRRFNPSRFGDAGVVEVLEGTATKGSSFTARFPAPRPLGRRVEDLVLSCAPKTQLVHVAGARVQPPLGCSPCYEECTAKPAWTPPAFTERKGVACRVRGESNLAEGAFFTEAGDVERVRGATDCPPSGLRLAGPPRIDWSVFPEGTTALRDVTALLDKKQEVSRSVRTVTVTRKGKDVELRDDGVVYPVDRRALSCWTERLLLHAPDLSFEFGEDACDGHDEEPKKHGATPVKALRCLQLGDEGWLEPTLVFVPGRVVERVDVHTGCTKQRAVRALPSLEAPTYLDR